MQTTTVKDLAPQGSQRNAFREAVRTMIKHIMYMNSSSLLLANINLLFLYFSFLIFFCCTPLLPFYKDGILCNDYKGANA